MLAAAVVPIAGLNLTISNADAERALAIARSRDQDRERFHAPYITTLNDPFIERVEIVSEFRRIVSVAEDHIRRGDHMFAYSARSVLGAIEPWKNRVSVVARLRFHPLNTYVDLPHIEMVLDGNGADAAFIGLLKDRVLAVPTALPGEHVPIVGAIVEGVWEADRIGQTQRTVTIAVDKKVVAQVPLNFARVE